MARRPNQRARSEPDPGVRLQKLIADAGLASRRTAETWIREGRVRLNGRVVTELGVRARPNRDKITVDGRKLGAPRPARHYLVYKPRGVVTTTRDARAKRTVLDLVQSKERLFPVGRLDAQSEGLLLLTNDGELAQVLLHPSFEVPRTYKVSVDGEVRAEALRSVAAGIVLDGERTAPCEVEIVEREADRTVLEIVLIEGRRRQIRRVMEAVGHPVRRLLRVRFGPLSLRGLSPGDARPLNTRERTALDRMVCQARTARETQRARAGKAGKRARARR